MIMRESRHQLEAVQHVVVVIVMQLEVMELHFILRHLVNTPLPFIDYTIQMIHDVPENTNNVHVTYPEHTAVVTETS